MGNMADDNDDSAYEPAKKETPAAEVANETDVTGTDKPDGETAGSE